MFKQSFPTPPESTARPRPTLTKLIELLGTESNQAPSLDPTAYLEIAISTTFFFFFFFLLLLFCRYFQLTGNSHFNDFWLFPVKWK